VVCHALSNQQTVLGLHDADQRIKYNNNHSDKPYLSASAPRLTLWGGGN
jgi:hypothetical protein